MLGRYFSLRVVRHKKRLPRDAVDAPCPGAGWIQACPAWCGIWQGVGARWSKVPFQPKTFHDSLVLWWVQPVNSLPSLTLKQLELSACSSPGSMLLQQTVTFFLYRWRVFHCLLFEWAQFAWGAQIRIFSSSVQQGFCFYCLPVLLIPVKLHLQNCVWYRIPSWDGLWDLSDRQFLIHFKTFLW